MNKLFKALDDPTRRRILELLREKDLTAGEIADAFDISKPSISHHLNLLKEAGVVSSFREGQFIFYSINTTVLDDLISWTLKLVKPKESTNENTKLA
ncbi:MAG: autorepressor SdpR family transcription factor [Hymenobacteraceae bacterium]|nr:autorepressor SdpR family transcription factor [Hymenobacteraceae bacterium]MDX5396137.1 autorepressor SdpR family transcription factor [Hymenobacteraceae bacterium]MDX5512198.1 autorepressor SdpR family transcription factor [Hymenobacteraceae bacterium]